MPNAPTVVDDAVLTAAETAALLGLSKFTLLRMRQRPGSDGLPFVGPLSPNRIGYVRRDYWHSSPPVVSGTARGCLKSATPPGFRNSAALLCQPGAV